MNQVRAGDIKYKDLNGDGTINDDDISWIGNGDIPKINYGFGFNLDYKAFSIGALFQGTAKADRLISGFVHAFNNSSAGNVFSNIDDRWTENNPNQNAFYPRLSYGNDAPGNQNNYVNSTWWLKDMSFFRLKPATFISYPRDFMPQIEYQKCKCLYDGNQPVYHLRLETVGP